MMLCTLHAFGQVPSAHRLGTNLDSVTDYSPQLPFLDIFSSSRAWLTQCTAGVDSGCTNSNSFDTGEASFLDIDSSGWVRSLPTAGPRLYRSVATYWDVASSFPGGRYIVRYDGAGTIAYQLGAQKIAAESAPGRDVITVNPAQGGILLRITATDPSHDGNYIRNIKVVAAADEASLSTTRFQSLFLNRLAPYNVLRFMDWMHTNNAALPSWSGRPKVTDARYSSELGVPVEVMTELANVSNKAPWFTLPHQADDSYITQFATVVRDTLKPSLPIYVEYSNEIWNDGFAQGSWIEDQAQATWPSSSESGFTKRLNWYGKRSAEICELWRSVFTTTPNRIICVIASQAANSFTASTALSCPLWDQAPCAGHGITALAIAPYFGHYLGQDESASTVANWTLQSDGGASNVFSELTTGGILAGGPAGGALAESRRWIIDNQEVAQNFNMPLITYEGGQHIVGVGSAADNDTLTELFTRVNRDKRMQAVYQSYLTTWQAAKGSLFMHFSDIGLYGKFGSWGALEETRQTSSPKYDALLTYAGMSPAATHILVVSRSGAGSVTSRPSGIRCGTKCRIRLASNSVVLLTARPSRRTRFVQWRGACKHQRMQCRIRMSGTKRVIATFTTR